MKIKVSDTNQFNADPNPTIRSGVGDFDGDGIGDISLAKGAACYYAPAGNAEWRFPQCANRRDRELAFRRFRRRRTYRRLRPAWTGLARFLGRSLALG